MTTVKLALPYVDAAIARSIAEHYGELILPNGPIDFVLAATACVGAARDYDGFVQEIDDIVNDYVCDMEPEDYTHVEQTFNNPVWLARNIELLGAFYSDYRPKLVDVFGPQRWVISEVVETNAGNTVVVELTLLDPL